MILVQSILWMVVFLIISLQALPAQSATYYISPTGSDTNPGTSAHPWLTFAYAINPARASCGDTILLKNGTYGDGTRTGKILITALVCTVGNELTVRAENQRKAKIVDDGSSIAVGIVDSAYIIIDGLYARSTDNSGSKYGTPFKTARSDNIIIRNIVAQNPNRYVNEHAISVEYSKKVLIEDAESYVFHRHCVLAWISSEVVARRVYCNPRGGRIAGGYNAAAGLGGGDTVMSMYPCRDCILENSIGDGTTHPMPLVEMNATFNKSTLMSGSKVLGSLCYKCNYGNGIYINSRNSAGINYTPQDITVRDVAIVDYNNAYGNGIRVSDGTNILLDHITIMGAGSGLNGIVTDDNVTSIRGTRGSTPSQNSITITNSLVTNMTGFGFRVTGFDTWSGDKLFSNGNRTVFSPALPSNWTDTSTKAHGMGTCKIWIPDGAAVKGAGTRGSDIGANILYRYVNGMLTNTPLWDPRTGEFPHGAEDLDGINRVEGESLFDIHKRLNVNRGGCTFPKNYGNGGSDLKSPASPVDLRASEQ